MRALRAVAVAVLGLLGAAAVPPAQAGELRRLLIAPQATDARLAADETPHLVVYEEAAEPEPEPEPGSGLAAMPLADAAAAAPPLLLVWLAGTHGQPATGPAKFFATVLQQGYRLVGLSYRTAEAVSQVCTRARLQQQPRCAEQFRQQRVWGEGGAGVVQDRPEDAIVSRLGQLLRHLAATDPAGRWARYLGAGDCVSAPAAACEPRWDRIVLAGQSQGGGMAAFLAQRRAVAGVVMFSGGWDHARDGGIAGWYGRPSQTPPQRWHATFHVDEPQAAAMAQIACTLGLPPEHIHALDLPVAGRTAHTEAIGNAAYQPLWQQMLPRR